jgi:transglutaminase-like putative cysteine protease
MEYTIAHRTFYYYPDSVHESYTVVHLQPRSDALQFCTKFELQLSPDARVSHYVDRFGNDVQHFAVLASHGALSITTQSHVVTLLLPAPPEPVEATRSLLDADSEAETMWDYLHESAYVQFTPERSLDRARGAGRARRSLPGLRSHHDRRAAQRGRSGSIRERLHLPRK